MKLEFTNKPTKDSFVIYPVFKNVRLRDAALNFLVGRLRQNAEFEAKNEQTFFLFEKVKSMPKKVLLLGLGDPKKINTTEILNAFGSAAKNAASHSAKKISIIFNDDLIPFAQEIAEGIVLGSYNAAPEYKTGEEQK
ncbi:MAG: M17 family peptidase N-terminal domain-containing protein, partial [Candidatus Gracilibacteria bacterium]